MLSGITQNKFVHVTQDFLLSAINVFVMEYHSKTSVIDVLSDQTHNFTLEFADVLLVTL
jgi:hypothetical protein